MTEHAKSARAGISGAVARLAGSGVGAVIAAVLAAALEARWVARAEAEPPPFAGFVLADLGVLYPVALAVGMLVGLASLYLHPVAAPSPRALARALRPSDPGARGYLAGIAFWSPLALLAWVIVAAQIGLGFLSSPLAVKSAGTAGALGSLAVAAVFWLYCLGVARALRGRLGRVSPLAAGAVGVLLAAAIFGYAVASGDTAGGGGPLALFGVLERPELDLRAPALLLLISLAAYLAPALSSRLPVAALAALVALPAFFTWRSAGPALAVRRIALGLERSAPLGKLALRRLRKLGDRDHDGFSARFGGGDCNDADPGVNPGADDVPGNGKDEDCSGKDAELVVLEKPEPTLPADARAWALKKIPEKLDVVLITVDTLRFDLGYMGNPRPVSPKIDALAKDSTVFARAYSLASYTSKSLPPALIGKYPSETHMGWAHFNRFDKADTFMAERAQKAGIRTISVQGYWYFYQPGVGFERGFDVIDTSASPKGFAVEGDKSWNGDKLTDAAIAELGKPENTEKQFFLWIHYVDPHSEYVKHEGFDFGSKSRDLYDSEVAFVDDNVGRLVDYIRKSSFGARTAIVLTSDHGEAFGEHGMIRHGFEEWEELIRVPFIVHVPGLSPGRIEVRRSAIDLVPTLLDLLRLPPPSGEGSDFVSGVSLLLDLARPPGYEPKQRIIFSHMAAGPNNADRQAFIDGSLKLIASDGRPMGIYDLDQDPGEKHDLDDDAALKEKLVGRYKAFVKELREVKLRRE
jgi:choline-sulfatase